MAVHVAYVNPMLVLNGTPLKKDEAQISQVLKADTEMRIIEDSSIPNSIGNPTIDEYVSREDNDGYTVIQVNNTMVVTQS